MDINNFDWGWMENPEVTDLKPLLIKEVFEDRIYEKFFTIDEGDIVLDIGSSVGPFAYSILDKKPKHIYCLEPSSVEFSTLNKPIIAIGGIDESNIEEVLLSGARGIAAIGAFHNAYDPAFTTKTLHNHIRRFYHA